MLTLIVREAVCLELPTLDHRVAGSSLARGVILFAATNPSIVTLPLSVYDFITVEKGIKPHSFIMHLSHPNTVHANISI